MRKSLANKERGESLYQEEWKAYHLSHFFFLHSRSKFPQPEVCILRSENVLLSPWKGR